MKKHIHYILFFVGITTILNACYDLDRDPYDKVKEETFWQTEAQVKQGLMGVYNSLKVDYGYGLKFAEDNLTDIGVGYDNQGYGPALLGTYTDRTALIQDKWKAQYDCVQRANTAIRKTAGSELSDSFKNIHIAEAKFLRALAYFDLATYYGAVPLYDETVILQDDYNNLKNPRSPLADVYAFILKDLKDVIESDLPVNWPKADSGRATKGAAYAFRAKVHLYMKNYDLAVTDFEEIILDKSSKGYGYSLHPNYAALFTPEGHNSSEMIFAIQNSGGVGLDYGMKMTFYMGTRSTFGSCWNNVMPSVTLADMYEMKDGKPFNWNDFIPDFDKFEIVTDDKGKKTEVHKAKEETFLSTLVKKEDGSVVVESYPKNLDILLDMYAQRDPRMGQTIILPYTKYNGWVSNTNKECEFVIARNMGPNEVNGFIRINGSWRENYIFRKFVPEGNMNGGINNREHTPINFALFRLADIYLMYAEAKSMLGDQDTAVKYINKVRQRPSTNLPALNSGPSWLAATTQEQVMERIKHERAVELVAEGHRFNDIRRWGDISKIFPTSSTRVNGILGQRVVTRSFTERDMLWPIPGVEIERNPLLKPNNPGWE